MDKELFVLGCVPTLLNILFEVANESKGFTDFKVIQNIHVEVGEDYKEDENINWEIVSLENLNSIRSKDAQFAFSVVGPNTKHLLFEALKSECSNIEKNSFPNVVHPKSYVSRSVETTYGLFVEPLSTISACTTIGFGVNIKRNCNIGHHCELGDYVTINPGVTMSSKVIVGERTEIGSGSSIKDGVSIGKNVLIGVGSVVVKDIPDNCIAFGNPCKVHRIKE